VYVITTYVTTKDERMKSRNAATEEYDGDGAECRRDMVRLAVPDA